MSWTPVMRASKRAWNEAAAALIEVYPSDFLALLDKARAAHDLPVLIGKRRERYEPPCGQRNHARDCLCDLVAS